MSFLDDLKGDDGSGYKASERAGNIAANTAKQSADAVLSNYLAKESEPAKRAAAILAAQGAQAIVNKIMAADLNKSPDPYVGMPDDGLNMLAREYFSTPKHTQNTYFRRNAAGGVPYTNAHPMYSSLFLVDFNFNQRVISKHPDNKLFSMLNSTVPMSMSFLLKNMTFPKITFDTVKLNQYNKYVSRPKRVIYDPINISFNDIYTSHNSTSSNRVSLMTMMREYVSYYTNDAVKDGHGLQNGMSSDREIFNLLSSIDIYFFWNSGAKKISLVNPFIESFSYGDLSYEDDNVMNLNTTVQYEYLDLHNIDININEFIESAGHLLEEVDHGHIPAKLAGDDDDMLDMATLQPIAPTGDNQRRIGLDNPVAAMAIRLAESAAMDKFGKDMSSSDPLKRAIAGGAYTAGMDAIGTTTSGVTGVIKGLF